MDKSLASTFYLMVQHVWPKDGTISLKSKGKISLPRQYVQVYYLRIIACLRIMGYKIMNWYCMIILLSLHYYLKEKCIIKIPKAWFARFIGL